MRLRWLAAGALVLATTACGSTPAGSNPDDNNVSPSTVNVASPDMVALKAKAHVEPCPAPQTTRGGLPNQTLKCLGGGRAVDLSTLKGPLVINVFQAACTECIKEEPALEAFHKDHGSQYPVLGIDGSDTYPGVALQEAVQRGVTYPMVADPGGDLQGGPLNVNNFPTFFFLHADGQITQAVGGKTSEAQILQMVTEQFSGTSQKLGNSSDTITISALAGVVVIGGGAAYVLRRRRRAAKSDAA